MPEISHPRSDIPVQGPAIQLVHSTFGVHRDTKAGEMDSHTQGFKKPPVPRSLVGESQIPHTQELVNNVSATGLADELREIRAGAQTRLRFCRLPVRLQF